MANPNVEDGHLKIADGLVLALVRTKSSAVGRRIMDAIMMMTYRSHRTKAQISIDDLRYALNEKKYLIERELEVLISRNMVFRQMTNANGQILGIQKDYEKWDLSMAQQIKLPQNGNAKASSNTSTNTNTSTSTLPQNGNARKSTPELYLDYLQREMAIHYTIGAWRRERSAAVEMYKLALARLHNPVDAVYAMRDYFEDEADLGFKTRVRMPATLLLKGFPRWLKYLPNKPKSVRADEEYDGIRYRWDSKLQYWQPTKDKLKRKEVGDGTNTSPTS